MNCKTTLEMLSAYLDRELAPSERDAVRAHLGGCDACRVEERELRALKGILLGVRAPEPAPDFERRLMGRIREEAARPVRAPLFPRFRRPMLMLEFGGLAVAGALAALVVLNRPTATSVPPVVVRPPAHSSAVDTDALQKGYEAYARAGDFAGGTGILTSYDAGP